MMTTSVGGTSGTEKAKAVRTSGGSEAFEALLAGVQSAQILSVTGAFAGATGLEARPAREENSARGTRVAQETEAARQAEFESRSTRRAHPSSVDRGTVSRRHERLVTAREAAASGSARTAGTEEPPDPGSASLSRRGARVPDEQMRPAARHEASMRGALHGADKGVVARPGPARPDISNRPLQPGRTPGASSSVDGAAAAASRARPTVGDERLRTPSSQARAVGRLLASRGAVEGPRSPADGQGTGPGRGAAAQDGAGRGARTRMGPEARADKTGSAEAPRSRREAQFLRLVSQVRLNSTARASSATIRLDPPELGSMRIEVRMIEDALSVRIEASTPRARQVLSERANELTAALREHNIEVERFEIVATRATEDGDASASSGSHAEQDRLAMDGDTRQDAPGGARRDQGETHPEETGGDGLEVDAPKLDAVGQTRLDVRV